MLSSRAAVFTLVAGATAFALVLAAMRRRPRRSAVEVPDEVVDETLMDSFPASDPPSYGAPTRTGSPVRR